MNLLALVPIRDWLYVGLIAIVFAGGAAAVHHERQVGAQRERQAVQAATIKAQAAAASETQRREVAIQEVVHATQLAASAVAADADTARRERASLRVQLDAVVRRSATPGNPASSTGGQDQQGGDPIGVLADVLDRADQRAGVLAEVADRRRVTAEACERAYGALMQAAN